MSSSFYFFIFIASIIIALVIVFIILQGKNGRTELYSEGIRNENDGRYNLALDNYENALNEIRQLHIRKGLTRNLIQRIKILRNIIEYEKNFQCWY